MGSDPFILELSNSYIILRREIAACMARVQDATWFDEHDLDLFRRIRLVFDTLGHDKHLAFRDMHRSIPEIDS